MVGRDRQRDLSLRVMELCLARGLTLSVAESCTGGLVGASLTSLSGSSRYFLGGVVAYSNDLKSGVLNVPATLLETEGAVSETVAETMAIEVATVTGADCGISVTGIAGPEGGTLEKPVGTVWIAVSIPGKAVSGMYNFEGDRNSVRRQAVNVALELFLETVI